MKPKKKKKKKKRKKTKCVGDRSLKKEKKGKVN